VRRESAFSGNVTKIGFSAHPQTSLCHRETSFNSREMQDNARPDLRSLGALGIDNILGGQNKKNIKSKIIKIIIILW